MNSNSNENILEALSGKVQRTRNDNVVSAASVVDLSESPKIEWNDLVPPTQACITDVASEVLSGNNVILASTYMRAGKSFIVDNFIKHIDRFTKNTNRDVPLFVKVNSAAGNLSTPNSLFAEIMQIANDHNVPLKNTCVITGSTKTAYVLSSLDCSIILESEIEDIAPVRSDNPEIFSTWHDVFVDDYKLSFNHICDTLYNVVAKENNSHNTYQASMSDVQHFVNSIFVHCENTLHIDPNNVAIGVYSMGFHRANMIASMNCDNNDSLDTIVKVMSDDEQRERILSIMGLDDHSAAGDGGIDDLMRAIQEAMGGVSPGGVAHIAVQRENGGNGGMQSHDEDSQKDRPASLRFRKPSVFHKELKSKIFGQDKALEDVMDSLMIPASKLNSEVKPLRSMMFVGPTGVGKTETALTIAEKMCTKKMNVIRLDMSEYMEQHSVNKLFGAPPSYVGFENGGQLTGEVKKHPQSVIILDEIEKAHDRVFDAFLQVLDAGRMTTGQGEEIDFSQCVIVMTSNAGVSESSRVTAGFGDNTLSNDDIHGVIKRELERKFRPEFLNRIDTFVYFDALSNDNIKKIVDNEVSILVNKLHKNHKVALKFNDENTVERYLLEKIDSRKYGAREVQRVISRELVNPVSRAILENSTKNKKSVVVSIDDTNTITATVE